MVYTCYDMVRDCRGGRPQGWRYFATHYVPLVRTILSHYSSDPGAHLERVLRALRDPASSLFQSIEPSPERWFVAELRQAVVAQLSVPEPEIPLELETVAEALEPLTVVEKQAAWLETMRYDAAATGEMMRISPQTVEKVRARSAELIRGKVDAWRLTLLAENGLALGRQAAASRGKDCLPLKAFLDILEGRTTWRAREQTEEHANHCWHCLDHFARAIEVVGLTRAVRPLSDAEAAPYWTMLGVEAEKKSGWKRIFGG